MTEYTKQPQGSGVCVKPTRGDYGKATFKKNKDGKETYFSIYGIVRYVGDGVIIFKDNEGFKHVISESKISFEKEIFKNDVPK